jgi:hypothetical protein
MSALDKIFQSCENLGNTLVQNGSVFLDSEELNECRKVTNREESKQKLSDFERKIMGKNRQSTKDKYLNKRQTFMNNYQDYVKKVSDLILRFKEEEIDRESFNREYKVLQNNYALIEKQITNFMNALYSQTNTYHSKSEENQYKSLLNLMYKKSVLEENEQSLKLSSNTVNKSEVINKNELEKFKRNYKIALFCFVFLAVLNIVLILRGIIF